MLAMEGMRWRVLRGVAALVSVTTLVGVATPPAGAQPDGGAPLLDAPTIPLDQLGSDAPLSFYGDTSSTSLTIPVPAGLVPAAVNATLDLPFNIRSGILTVTQDDRLISKVPLPLADLAPVVIPLDGVRVADDSATVTLSLSSLAEDGFCFDQFSPVELVNGTVSYTGAEAAPTTVADFLPPILRRITIATPAAPSPAEADTAVQLAAALSARYRGQVPQVALVPLADGATTPSGPPGPSERQIVVKEGPDEGLSLVGAGGGIPALLVSGAADDLKNQSRLLTDPSLNMAVSPKVVAGPLHQNASQPGDSTTLALLNQPTLSSTGLSPQVSIALDQTRFGHPTQGFRVHLTGSHTPTATAFGGRLTAAVGGEVIDSWPTEPGGVIDHWVDVPDRLVKRYTDLAVQVDTSGNTGRCGEFEPITLSIDGDTVVESTPAQPPIPQGFPSMPQALMPQTQVGIAQGDFADTVRATQVVVGLQRLSVVPLQTTVTSVEDALAGTDPAVIISANGWNDQSIRLPVSADDRKLTFAGPTPDAPPTTLTLDPAARFGSLQTVFDERRSLLVATSNGAPDALDQLLRRLDDDPQDLQQAAGSAIVAFAGQAPISVVGQTPASVYGPVTSASSEATAGGQSKTVWWIAIGVAVVAAGVLAVLLRSRRTRRTAGDGGPRHGNGQP